VAAMAAMAAEGWAMTTLVEVPRASADMLST
jgi:hypothetical protein